LPNRELLFRYLLGDLPQEERRRIQEDTGAIPALREHLQEAESDLIDAYVCERLSEAQRGQFESYFLNSPEKRERVEFAQILLSPAVRSMAPAPEFSEFARDRRTFHPRADSPVLSFTRWGWAMATLALAIAIVFMVTQNVRLRAALDRSTSSEVNSQNQIANLKNQISQLHRTDTAATVPMGLGAEVYLLLSPGQQRSGEDSNGPAILKFASLPTVALTLELEQDRYPQYEVQVATSDGKEVLHKRGLKSQMSSHGDHVIVARLSSELLAAGDYIVKVSAQSPSGERRNVDAYAFTVTR